jgi:membrane fusion protein (multidrug efflux system)
MKNTILLCTLALGGMLISCSDRKQSENDKEGVETSLPTLTNGVTVMTLKKSTFNHELISNGKVSADSYADLYFRTPEVIAHIWVKNGEHVRKGQKIAELDLFRLNNSLSQTKNSMKQSQLEMQDVLIGQGYSPDKTKNIPDDVMELAGVKSGYIQSKAQYESAQYDVQQATLTAPFDGVVANLFSKSHNMAKTAEPFCRIINTGDMEVDFTALESELPLVRKRDKVAIIPYAATVDECSGSVSEINPSVDDNGMVRIKAKVNGNGKLFNGMNVRVSVHRSVPDQLVIPKSAVVLRSGKQVVFTLDKGKSMWNYVTTGLENMNEYTVTDGLEEGMQVITSGNVNLAHESPVRVVKENKTVKSE